VGGRGGGWRGGWTSDRQSRARNIPSRNQACGNELLGEGGGGVERGRVWGRSRFLCGTSKVRTCCRIVSLCSTRTLPSFPDASHIRPLRPTGVLGSARARAGHRAAAGRGRESPGMKRRGERSSTGVLGGGQSVGGKRAREREGRLRTNLRVSPPFACVCSVPAARVCLPRPGQRSQAAPLLHLRGCPRAARVHRRVRLSLRPGLWWPYPPPSPIEEEAVTYYVMPHSRFVVVVSVLGFNLPLSMPLLCRASRRMTGCTPPCTPTGARPVWAPSSARPSSPTPTPS